MELILRDFDTNWKLGVEEIKKNLKKCFSHSPLAAQQMLEFLLENLHTSYQHLIGIMKKGEGGRGGTREGEERGEGTGEIKKNLKKCLTQLSCCPTNVSVFVREFTY